MIDSDVANEFCSCIFNLTPSNNVSLASTPPNYWRMTFMDSQQSG